jgi:hypothetical protein
MLRRFSLLLPAVLALSACTAQSPAPSQDAPAKTAAPPTTQDVTPMQDASTATAVSTQIKPPSPESVLYFISNIDGDGATSYEIENGSWISYWYGYQFEFGGKHYFTGFATETAEKYTQEQKESTASPETTVTLTQATFEADPSNTKTPWKWQGTELWIGDFGGFGKANAIDPDRKPQTFATSDGNLLLAMPTWYLAPGSKMRTIEILLFNPHDLEGTDNKRWRYLGTLEAGSNNDVSCGPDAPGNIACVDTTGTLAFEPAQDGKLPNLRVTLSGKGLDAGDTPTEYRYDPAHTTYRPTSR